MSDLVPCTCHYGDDPYCPRHTPLPGEDVPRPASVPAEGQIEPFDAGWNGHRIGIGRDTVEVLATDAGWALLGWDTRDLIVERANARASGSEGDTPRPRP